MAIDSPPAKDLIEDGYMFECRQDSGSVKITALDLDALQQDECSLVLNLSTSLQ